MKTLFLIIYFQIWICLMQVYLGLNLIQTTFFGLALISIGSSWFLIGVGLCMKLIVVVWKTRLARLSQG